MPHFLTDIGLLASQNRTLAYFIIYIATIIIGNVSAFAGLWLMAGGSFGVWGVPLLALTIFAANASGDLLWYSLGFTLRDTRFGAWLHKKIPGREKVEAKMKKNGRRLILMSKFMYASAFPVIFSVGWCRMNFKKFINASLLSILIVLPILFALAYGLVFGLSPLGATAFFKSIEVLFLVSIVFFFIAEFFIVRLFRLFLRNGNDNGNAEEISEVAAAREDGA